MSVNGVRCGFPVVLFMRLMQNGGKQLKRDQTTRPAGQKTVGRGRVMTSGSKGQSNARVEHKGTYC